MADITNLFKATVKAISSRKKALDEGGKDANQLILSKKQQKGRFESEAKALVKSITELRDFLEQNRKEYVTSGSLLSNHGAGMSESERDQIDGDAQQIIQTCKATIGLLRKEMNGQNTYAHVKEHQNSVMILIQSYLKAICKIYSEQRAVRVKRVVDRKKISKLEPERKHSHLSRTRLKKEMKINQGELDESQEKQEKTDGSTVTNKNKTSTAVVEDSPYSNDDLLSPEEIQMFELENNALYSEMNSMAEEVKQIEGQVVEIAKLQEIFTEKVLEQDVQINAINTTTVGATENIKDANEEIRKAIKKKAEFRVWILFFLVVLSLTLLFLDWYNG